jgi:hypothetical protein
MVTGKIGRVSRFDIIHECASDIARKMPGNDEPTYLNQCEQLLTALRLP